MPERETSPQDALQRSEDELRRMQRLAGVVPFDIDVPAGLTGIRSASYVTLHGLPAGLTTESHQAWLARVHPDDRAAAEKTLFEALAGSGPSYDNLYRIVRPSDGEVRWIHAKAEIERDAAGRALRLAGIHVDVTVQKEAERALEESRAMQGYLLQLSDALRSGVEPASIEADAARILGRFLGVGWCFYGHTDERLEHMAVRTEYLGPGAASLLGVHPVASLSYRERLMTGEPVVVDDMQDRPQVLADGDRHFESLGMRSIVSVPVVKDGRMVAVLVAADGAPRRWSGQDREVVRETAERTWQAGQRGRIELALRESEDRLRLALDAGRMGTYRFDVRTGIEHWSDSEYEMLGVTKQPEAPTRDLFLSLVHPDDLHLVQFSEDDGREPGTALDTEFRIVRPDTGEVRILTAHALARFDAEGAPVEVIGVNQDVTDERRAATALRVSEERLQQFSAASLDILWIRNAATLQWEYLSPAFDRIFGVTRQDALKPDNFQRWLGFIVPEDREKARDATYRVVAGESVAFEYRLHRPDGQIRWLRNTDFPMRNEAGVVTRIAGVGSDVTDLKDATEHQRVLLAELQHRVRNTLSVVRSIARRTAGTSVSVDDYAMKLEGRIDAFARVQSAVTRDPHHGVDLAMLVAEEMRAASLREGEGLHIDGPPVRLQARAAETFALAVHELATNAIKYGALTMPHGRVDIAWSVEGGGSKAMLVFTWRERGLTGLALPTRTGLGSEILQRTIVYELGAETILEYRSTGVICTVRMRFDRVATASPGEPS